MQKIKLRFGLIIDFIVQSTASFDLSGQIVISIWNRNSYSSIQKKLVDTFFLILKFHSQISFSCLTFLESKLIKIMQYGGRTLENKVIAEDLKFYDPVTRFCF